MMGWQFMGAGGWLWMLASIVFIAGLVVLIFGAIGAVGGRERGDDAIQALRARFARGEIDEEQYTKVREVLGPRRSEASRSRRGLLLGGVALVVAALVLGVLAWASSGGYGGMMGMMGMMVPAPTAPAGTSVTMAATRFTLATLTIKVGETVRWFNDDLVPHTVTASDRDWDSGNLAPGAAFERRFDAAGTYAYVCLYHSWMTATVVVHGP
jgi:plastocyanin